MVQLGRLVVLGIAMSPTLAVQSQSPSTPPSIVWEQSESVCVRLSVKGANGMPPLSRRSASSRVQSLLNLWPCSASQTASEAEENGPLKGMSNSPCSFLRILDGRCFRASTVGAVLSASERSLKADSSTSLSIKPEFFDE